MGWQFSVGLKILLMNVKGGLDGINGVGLHVIFLKDDHESVTGGFIDISPGSMDGIHKAGKQTFNNMVDFLLR